MEKFVQTVQQQPKPLPLKRPHVLFFEDTVGLLPSNPTPKRYRPESVDSFVTQWVESASGSGSESYRERHCRSDTLLGHSDSDIIPRRLTKSAPNIEYTRDANGFALPPTPASTGSRPYAQSVGPLDAASSTGGSNRSSGKSLVENPLYRVANLASNNIYIRSRREEFPEHISSLVDHVGRDRASPDPSAGDVVMVLLGVATNQCLGGSTSCVNIAERLNRQLRRYKRNKVQPINSAASSIVMNGTEVRLYISWKHDELKNYTRKVDSFLLQKPKDYVEFRKYVLNIIDWGKDDLLEENRKIASQQAKSRPPPPSSDDSASSSSQKRKSPSRGRNSKAKPVQEDRSGGVNETYWKLGATYNRYFHSDGDGNITWAEDEGEPSSAQQ
ncbi:hypothetical protein BJ875DRAFT_534914 [Amylocarpus encephaloides]|uniref:DUF7924 domain-containing protein n=1 Tax=Amylocarpus encephaloides TaxID=45428 RepID=A0A9P7YI21_9HELO|nr:hypothetical protein BJ875DRAFT_534914 [Amylocarpus encephaloides]